jgi:broad specificity phosphatase PhoE
MLLIEPMDIIIFRHGEKQETTESNDVEVNRNVALSQNGINQIEKLADYLYLNHPDLIGLKYIYSSPFPRTIEGAEIVRRKLKIEEIKSEIVLKEIYGAKDYSFPPAKRKEMHEFALRNFDFINETGYSYRQRANEVLDFFKKKYFESVGKMLISGHGGIIRAIIRAIDEEYFNTNLQKPMSEGSLIRIKYESKIFRVLS